MLKYLLYYDVEMRHEIHQLKKTILGNFFFSQLLLLVNRYFEENWLSF